MKTNRITFFLIVFISFQFIGFSQQNTLSPKEIAAFKKEVALKAKNTNTLSSNFTQTKQISVLNNSIISTGKLVYKSPNLVRWEYITPKSNIAIFKDNLLLVFSDGKRKSIDLDSNKWFKQLNTLIVNSVTGDLFDDETFEIDYFSTKTGYLVVFKPKNKRLRKYMAQFELTFPKHEYVVKTVKLIEPNNDFTLIEFKNRVDNKPVLDTAFTL